MSNPYNTPGTTGVYTITCTASGKAYVGSSKNVEARWRRHIYDLRHGVHHCIPLQRAYNKYGEDSLLHTIIEVCDAAETVSREQHYIDLIKPEYNTSITASTPAHTPAVIEKMRRTMQQVWSCPDRRKAQSERVKDAGQHPAFAEGRKQMWNDPARRADLLERRAKREYVAFNRNWTLKELSAEFDVSYGMLKDRVRAGWDIERAVTEPKRKGGL